MKSINAWIYYIQLYLLNRIYLIFIALCTYVYKLNMYHFCRVILVLKIRKEYRNIHTKYNSSSITMPNYKKQKGFNKRTKREVSPFF